MNKFVLDGITAQVAEEFSGLLDQVFADLAAEFDDDVTVLKAMMARQPVMFWGSF